MRQHLSSLAQRVPHLSSIWYNYNNYAFWLFSQIFTKALHVMRFARIILFCITTLLMPAYLAGGVSDSEIVPIRPFHAVEVTGNPSLDQELATLAYVCPQNIHLILPSTLLQEVVIISDPHKIINGYLDGDMEYPYDEPTYIGIAFLKAFNTKISSSKTSEENTTEKDATEKFRKDLKIVSSLIPACKTTPGLLTKAILDSLNDLAKKGYITSNSSDSMSKLPEGQTFMHYIDARKSSCFGEIPPPMANPPQNQLAIIAGSHSWAYSVPPLWSWNNNAYCLVSVLYKNDRSPLAKTFAITREQDQKGRYNDDWHFIGEEFYYASHQFR